MGFVIGCIGIGCYVLGVYTSQWAKPGVEKVWRRLKAAIESRE